MKQLIFIVLLLLSSQIQGQDAEKMETYPITSNYVIAVPGLNMRTAPGLDSEKVSYIPYGNEIEILEPHKFYRDTIGEIKNYHKGNQRNIFSNPVLEGDWVKASYKGNVGYVFSAYLMDNANHERFTAYKKKIETPDINKDYVLLFERAVCMSNYHFDKDWYYYAAQKTPTGICLEPTKLSFIKMLKHEYQLLRITSDIQDYDPVFIIGSRYQLSQNEIYSMPNNFIIKTFNDRPQVEETVLEELSLKPVDGQYARDIILNRNGQLQILNPLVSPRKMLKNNPLSIIFKGDIDRDGQDDYIIGFGEMPYQAVLYLSSEAASGQLVKPVAIWHRGSCS